MLGPQPHTKLIVSDDFNYLAVRQKYLSWEQSICDALSTFDILFLDVSFLSARTFSSLKKNVSEIYNIKRKKQHN